MATVSSPSASTTSSFSTSTSAASSASSASLSSSSSAAALYAGGTGPTDVEAHYARSWDFYRSIGAPKFVVAPMVHQSELPFRMLTRKYKADLCYTPMIHSKNFSKDKKYRAKSFQTCAEDRPLFAQFCGDDAAALINAAKYIEGEVDAVDINLGCPQGIARRGHYGSFLLEEPDLICHLVRSLYDNLKCPVTCKIRLLPDYKTNPQKTIDLAVRLQNSGCSILTVHGRTREMIKNAIGPCDFEMIKRIKAALRIPVFSNGGIETFENISECLAATKADGVMVSEAILGIPQLFDPVKTATDSVGPLEIAKELIAFFKRYPGVDGCLKPHLFKILFKELAFHTDIRSTLGGGTVEDVVRIPDLLAEAQKKLIEEGKVLSEEYKAFPIWYSRHQTHKHVVEKAAAQALQNEQKLDEKESRCVECVDVSANGQDGSGYEVAAEKVGDKRPLDSQRNEGGNSKKGKTE